MIEGKPTITLISPSSYSKKPDIIISAIVFTVFVLYGLRADIPNISYSYLSTSSSSSLSSISSILPLFLRFPFIELFDYELRRLPDRSELLGLCRAVSGDLLILPEIWFDDGCSTLSFYRRLLFEESLYYYSLLLSLSLIFK